jgi:hypothetical protein
VLYYESQEWNDCYDIDFSRSRQPPTRFCEWDHTKMGLYAFMIWPGRKRWTYGELVHVKLPVLQLFLTHSSKMPVTIPSELLRKIFYFLRSPTAWLIKAEWERRLKAEAVEKWFYDLVEGEEYDGMGMSGDWC